MSTAPRNKDRDRDRDRELSEILQEAQLLRAEVVQRAESDAKKLGEPLWRWLIREGLLTDEQLFRVLKQYVRVPVLAEEHLENVVVPPELLEALQPRLAQSLGVLPLERSTDGRRAALAMIDPTIDIAPLWPALSQLGVVEVRRFLLNLATLRRGMQMFYGQSYEAAAADTGLDGPTPPPSRSAITQPIPRPAPEAPSVMVDPGLQAEIEQLSGSLPVPKLPEDAGSSGEAAAASSPGRPAIPEALLATMPSSRSVRGSEPPSRRSSSAPVGQSAQTPQHRVGSGPGEASSPAIPIEIDLQDLLKSSPGESSQVTPSLRELSELRSQPASGRSGQAAPPAGAEGLRAPLGPGNAGPAATSLPAAAPAGTVPPPRTPTTPPTLPSAAALPPSISPDLSRTMPPTRRSPTAPPMLPSAAAPPTSSMPPEVSRTAPSARRSPTAPPVLPAAGSPPAGSALSEVSRTAPPIRRSPTAPPLPPALPSTESARSTPTAGRLPTVPPLPPVLSTPTGVPQRVGLGMQGPAAPLATQAGGRPTAGPEQAGKRTLAPSAQSPLQELTAADMVLDDDRGGLTLNRRELRVPAAPSELAPAVAQDAVQDALITTCEALASTAESQLHTTWPTTLARLCQGVGDQLGFAPRAVRELMLVARLRGVVRAELLTRGPLPPPRPTLLGYPTSSPLLGAARELQKVLVDFMRLPRDEDEPLGMRIVGTAAQALELRDKGLSDDELVAKLREQLGDTDVVFQVHKALALNPPDEEPPPAPTAAPVYPPTRPPAAPAVPVPTEPGPVRVPALWPLPPRMPTVPWTTLRLAELSDEGFLPYQPEEA